MLVLTRELAPRDPAYADLVLTLPDGRTILVTVSDKGPGRVRVGIRAPRDVRVDRRELLERREGAR